MNILNEIIATKTSEVRRAAAQLPRAILAPLAESASAPRGFARALARADLNGPAIIAEVKRASPARGVLRPQESVCAWQPEALARAYEQGGAAALSVLTDVRYFWGSPDTLAACREATGVPVLRKDFIVDVYQIDESRVWGADAVLLIARVLSRAQLTACAARAQALGMDVLIEVHGASELDQALAIEGALVGINNRDLSTMEVDIERAARLCGAVPADRWVVAESGLSQPEQLAYLRRCGVRAFLIGEHLVRQADPQRELVRLRGA